MATDLRRALGVALALCCVAAPALAGQQKLTGPARTKLGPFVIEAKHLEGVVGGAWVFSKGVTATAPSGSLSCETLKLWPTKAGRDVERAEATGKVVVRARYLASDQTEWQIVGTAGSASYDAKAGEGVLRGGVKFDGLNLTTGGKLRIGAEKLTYDLKSRQFRFDKAAEKEGAPVRVEWEEPEQPAQEKAQQ